VTKFPATRANLSLTSALATLAESELRVPVEFRACVAGEEEQKTPDGLAVCRACEKGTFNRGAGTPCEACPADFVCDEPGMSLQSLPLKKGFMRMRDSSTVALPCADGPAGKSCPAAAAGAVRVGCDPEGHTEGPKCSLCEKDYFWDGDAMECVECEGSLSAASAVTIVSILILALCFVGLVYVLVSLATSSSGDVKTAGKMGRLRNKLKSKWKIIFVGAVRRLAQRSARPGLARRPPAAQVSTS